jgi:hypothetical protein
MEKKTRMKKAQKGQPKIVVTGDVAVDWFEVAAPPKQSSSTEGGYEFNWETHPTIHRFARPGGALLLAKLVRSATQATILAPELADIEHVPLTKAIRSFASLKPYPYSATQGRRTVYRIDEFKGFAGDKSVLPLPVKDDDPNADLIVFDDTANGFRNKEFQRMWPNALESPHSYVILKMSQPLLRGDLWESLQKQAEKLTVILTAEDLRQRGVRISRQLSWERTAQDFVWQMAANPELLFLNSCDYLIIRFGVDGVILYKRLGGNLESWLFFDPEIGEDGFRMAYPGKMAGVGNAFVAALVSEMAKGTELERVKEGVRKGFCAMRRMWQLGLGEDIDHLDYPYEDIFVVPEECDFKVASVRIPDPSDQGVSKFWCILEDVAKSVEEMAYNFVLKGSDPALDLAPVGRFGKLVTLDRSEIESFSSIKNLIKEYLDSLRATRPLCIAVFGPPGSGKSFGVTEVAKSVAPGKLSDEPLEFNLSQFNSTDDLVTAFHKVRDVALTGKTPIVFFDEFDAEFNGKLGWLKYFLGPMQDGRFRHGEVVHPIGKAIFVFAGGTRSTLGEFSMERADSTKKSAPADDAAANIKATGADDNELEAFKTAKGTDFVSRLRGYVNIKGPNQIDEADKLYMIRRAIALRFQLKKNAKHIFSGSECLIDLGVLRAFIKVPHYKHGIRSIQAIIEMSVLSDRKSFEQVSLPPPEQLELHVNAEEFSRLVIRDVLLGDAREKLAEAIHEKYREDNKGSKDPEDSAMAPWEKLREDFKESNRRQADDIPVKLKAIGCDFIPVFGEKPKRIEITEEEYEKMAAMEHQSFVRERLLAGWSQGNVKDDSRKIRTDLVEWAELSDELKEYDRKAVKAIPGLLAQAGFEIYRLK